MTSNIDNKKERSITGSSSFLKYYMSVAEAREFILKSTGKSLSCRWIEKLCVKKKLEAHKMGNMWIISKWSIENYISLFVKIK